jgi:hypothetical protein
MAMKFKFMLICDDARIEQSGKVIIVGLYNHSITFKRQVATPPQSGEQHDRFVLPQLTLLRRWEIDDSTEHTVTTRITGPHGEIMTGESRFSRPASEPYLQEIISFRGPILTEGAYTISTTWDGPPLGEYTEQFEVSVVG